jgi:MoaA/NifB/PqqE/SkfB family radical SAM enzyme
MDLPDKNVYRPLSEIISQLDEYTNLKYLTIAGAVAEPTAYPNLFELLAYLKKREIEIELYINGDTRDDIFYRNLGIIFRGYEGNVYFTICGSTQELHEKYRVGSKLDRVLKRLDIVNRHSGNRGVLTWIVFNYNEQDFSINYLKYADKYRTEFFYSVPITEHLNLDRDIHLPDHLHKIYESHINKEDFDNVSCPSMRYGFIQITYEGNVHPCSLHRLYGETHCFECSERNTKILNENKIYHVAEGESDVSEIDLRIYYDRKEKSN